MQCAIASCKQKCYDNSVKTKMSSSSKDNSVKKSKEQHKDACGVIKDIVQNQSMNVVTFLLTSITTLNKLKLLKKDILTKILILRNNKIERKSGFQLEMPPKLM